VPTFVISLDFEMFWGVADTAAIGDYGPNVEGEWSAVPAMLSLFRRHRVNATWATVGMVMCRDHAQWSEIRPDIMPAYSNPALSAYSHADAARSHPRLFFGRPLVEQILDTPGQEIASHTYSHYLCGEEGAAPDQFAADMRCAAAIARELGVAMHSLVLPRNQVIGAFLAGQRESGMRAFRGNSDHWLYRNGHEAPGGLAGRAVRLADAWLPLRSATAVPALGQDGMINVPASMFLRPWSRRLARIEPLRLRRLREAMTAAARSDGLFHLWWHPHNFGVNQAENLNMLEAVLQHFARLRDEYGMASMTMHEFAKSQDDLLAAHARSMQPSMPAVLAARRK
jgi:peptidoglycan/xylan/chitin deacetylase (PgdA/CDA1 family)